MSIGNQATDASKFSLRNICSEHISLYPYPYRCPLSHKRCHLLDVCDGTAHVPNTIIVLSFAHGKNPHLNTTFRCYYYAESQSYIYVNNLVRMDFKTSLTNGIVARRTFPKLTKAQPYPNEWTSFGVSDRVHAYLLQAFPNYLFQKRFQLLHG